MNKIRHLKLSRPTNGGRFHKVFLWTVLICLGLLVVTFLKLNQIKNNIFLKSDSSSFNVQGYSPSLANRLKSGTPLNILLLGYGGGNHDGTYLTDSMMITHVDPLQKKVTLISIPRDIWVKIPTNGDNGSHWKINAAYELGLDDADYPNKAAIYKGPAGGGNLVKYVVQQITGLPIDYFIALDFNGFTNTINTLGGVDVNVETAFDDYEYPIDGKENDLCGHPASDLPMLEAEATQSAAEVVFPCRYQHLHFQKGMTHMDGTTALEYVRSRHSLQDGTDFGRAARQRNLIEAVKSKVLNVGFISKIIPFTLSLQNDLKTDLSVDEVKQMIDMSGTLSSYQISGLALTNQNVLQDSFSTDGQATLLPIAGLDEWGGVHDWITSSLNPNQINSNPVIQVENGTLVDGLATLAVNRLQDENLNVLSPSNSTGQTKQTTTITSYNSHIDPAILAKLKQEFNVSNIVTNTADHPTYDILVILGQDYNLSHGKKLLNGP